MEIVYKSDKIEISVAQLGMLGNNVYVLASDSEQALVDPSCNTGQILEMTNNKLDKILLTHYHWDHTRALAGVHETTQAKTYASSLDAPYIEDPDKAPLFRQNEPCKVDVKLNNGDEISIGSTT